MLLFKMQILKFQLFLIHSMSSIWREWEGVRKRLESLSPSRPLVPQKTLSYSIDPNQKASPQCTAQQHRKTPLCSSYLEISYLPIFFFFFFLCQLLCCYDYGAFDVIPGFFEAKLALHAQCCNLQYWGTNKVA